MGKTIGLFALLWLFVQHGIAQPGPDNLRPPHRPQSPVRQYMAELRNDNPAEFERLQKLRMEDPEAFRTQMQAAMQARLLSQLATERPSVHAALSKWPAEDLAWMFEKLHGEGKPRAGELRRQAVKNGESQQKARQLVKRFRAEQDPSKKAALEEELRSFLAEEYDRQMEFRRGQLQEMEDKIQHLRETLNEGAEQKQQFIDQKISNWLETPETSQD